MDTELEVPKDTDAYCVSGASTETGISSWVVLDKSKTVCLLLLVDTELNVPKDTDADCVPGEPTHTGLDSSVDLEDTCT